MIGIIVAASVIAVVFIVMAAVIPVIKQDVQMQIRPDSVFANSTDSTSIRFSVMCDYNDGDLWRVEAFKNDQLYGYKNVNFTFDRNQEKIINIEYLLANTIVPSQEVNGSNLVFQDGDTYTLRIYFRNMGDTDTIDWYTEQDFVFEAMS